MGDCMDIEIKNLVSSFIIVVIALVIYYLISKLLNNNKIDKNNTYFVMIKSAIKYIFFILVVLVILQVNGIDVSGMLAGLGIAGAIIGLAVQDSLKDIIRGISIISEKYFKIGDVVKIGDNTGIVLKLGIKTTKIKDVYTDNLVSIANRNIEKVEVLSTPLHLNIPFSYDLKLSEVEKVMEEIKEEVSKIDKVIKAEYRGVTEFSDSSIDYRLYVEIKPEYRISVRRKILTEILRILEKNNISIPYKQLDIHNK